MKTVKNVTLPTFRLFGIVCAVWPLLADAALPTVPGATTAIYASVPDPIDIDIGDDGVMFVGRDNFGTGGTSYNEAVKIHRIGRGGVPVEEFGNAAVPDPDTVVIDRAGVVSGIPGAVLVGGNLTSMNDWRGRLSKIAPDGTVTILFNQSSVICNAGSMVFDQSGRLLIASFFLSPEDANVVVVTSGVPAVLFSKRGATSLAVDSQNRIVVSSSLEPSLSLYTTGGSLINASFAPAKLVAPLALARGGFWGTDIYTIGTTGQLQRVSTNGNVTAIGSGFTNITDMVFGPNEALYLSEFNADRILSILPVLPPPRTNTPPSLATIAHQTTREDTPTPAIAFTVSDAETPVTNLVVTGVSSNPGLVAQAGIALAGSGTNQTITLTPLRDQFGVTTISLTARDTDGLTATNRFDLTVTPVNDPPTLDPISNITVDENSGPSIVKLTGIGTGAPNEVQTLRVTAVPSNPFLIPLPSIDYTSLNVEGALRFTPVRNVSGTNTITVTVDDGGPENATISRTFLIVVRPVNHPPTISRIDEQRIDEGARFGLSIQAKDPDLPAQTLVYSLEINAPPGASIQRTTGLFVWTPTEAQGPSTNLITVRVTDNGTPPLSTTTNFTVIVNEVNLHPVLAPIPDQTIQAGEALTARCAATDPDLPANLLSFSLDSGAPAGASIDSKTGVFTWTPSGAQAPSTNRITVRVTDDGSPPLSDSKTFTVLVQGPTNVLSVAITNPPSRTTFCPGSTISVAASVTGNTAVSKVEFYSGTRLLSVDETSPFSFALIDAQPGNYVLTAKAIAAGELSAVSVPVEVSVSDICGEVAIIRNFADPEIDRLRDYLFEMGLNSVVFDQEGLSTERLLGFKLVIWDDLGKGGLTGNTARVLRELQASKTEAHLDGMPIYFIGENLASANPLLSANNQTEWLALTHMKPAKGKLASAEVRLLNNGEAFNIINGRFGLAEDFLYEHPLELAEAAADAEPLALAGEAMVLVRHPRSDASEGGRVRSITQNILVVGGGTGTALEERKKLFKNAVCWLYRCPDCVNSSLGISVVEESVRNEIGAVATNRFRIANNGACEAIGARFSVAVPEGLIWRGVEYSQGLRDAYNPETRLATLELGRVGKGSAAAVEVSIRLEGTKEGRFPVTARTQADNIGIREELVFIEVEQGIAPKIIIERAGASDSNSIRLRVMGKPNQIYHVQVTTSLIPPVQWTEWMSFNGLEWISPIINTTESQKSATYYRVLAR